MTYSVGLNVWMENQSPGPLPSPLSRYVLICQAAGSVLRGSIYICVKCRRLCLPGAESSFPAWHAVPWARFWDARGLLGGCATLPGVLPGVGPPSFTSQRGRSVGKARHAVCSGLCFPCRMDEDPHPAVTAGGPPRPQQMWGSGDPGSAAAAGPPAWPSPAWPRLIPLLQTLSLTPADKSHFQDGLIQFSTDFLPGPVTCGSPAGAGLHVTPQPSLERLSSGCCSPSTAGGVPSCPARAPRGARPATDTGIQPWECGGRGVPTVGAAGTQGWWW